MANRKTAKKILFDQLKNEGWLELIFSNGKLSDSSAVIEIIIDAMVQFKNTPSTKKQNDEIAVEFLEWKDNLYLEGKTSLFDLGHGIYGSDIKKVTTKQLFHIFKQEKGY